MNSTISPLLDAKDLLNLQHNEDLILIDASFGAVAKENYDQNHLKGAFYIDLNSQLSSIKDPAKGGRHPLPVTQLFSETLTSFGITPNSHVVIYDDKNGANSASRLWWMLKAIGHQKVQVLNGNMRSAIDLGFPSSSNQEKPKKTEPYILKKWNLPIATIKEVEKASESKDHLIIDVREKSRFLGENEPIDLIAGHIPNAINIPFQENLNQEGFFLPSSELKKKYEAYTKGIEPENVIIHCGSGVTACHTILAFAYAGLTIPKLYVGSWSEWSRNNKPMITKS